MGENKEYNYGLALLKVFSMIGIVILHILNNGGVYLHAKIPSGLHIGCEFIILPLVSCSVNCFAITSGYLAVHTLNRPFSIKRWAELWLEVVFYGLVLMLAAHFIIGSQLNFIKSLFPVTQNEYWYFTAYTGLMFFLPIINGYAVKASDSALKKILMVMLAYYLVHALAYQQNTDYFLQDIMSLNKGYSVRWLMILYICGLIIGKTRALLNIKTLWLLLGALTGMILYGVNYEFDYIYPPIVLTSFALFLLFERIRIRKGNIIKLFSIHSFAVYIVNTQPNWFEWYKYRFVFLTKKSAFISISFIILFAVLFFVIVSLADVLRSKLFKALRAQKLCEKADKLLRRAVDLIASKL